MQRLWSREIWLLRREADMRGAPNIQMEPTRQTACAITSLRRAAHLQR
jgi:hypothetical protein